MNTLGVTSFGPNDYYGSSYVCDPRGSYFGDKAEVAQMLFGSVIAPPPAYGLVGMGAVLAGAIRAPITGLMLPFAPPIR